MFSGYFLITQMTVTFLWSCVWLTDGTVGHVLTLHKLLYVFMAVFTCVATSIIKPSITQSAMSLSVVVNMLNRGKFFQTQLYYPQHYL